MSSLMSGYVDRSGAFVIAPNLFHTSRFEGDLAKVSPFGNRQFGFINRQGQPVTEMNLDFFGGWSEGVATFNVGGQRNQRGGVDGGRWGMVGQGRVLVPPTFEGLGKLRNGLLAARAGERWGYVDTTGQWRIEPRFEVALDFEGDAAIVAESGRDGIIRADGTFALVPSFEQLGSVGGGRATALRDGHWYLIDLAGNVLSDGYEGIAPFVDGMARVSRDGKVGFIDASGRLLAGEWFDHSEPYSDGIAAVKRGDDAFFITAGGAVYGPYQVTMAFGDGLGRAVTEAGVGFVRADGSFAIEPRYQSAKGFVNGFAAVKRDDRWTYVRPDGSELHAPHWERAESFGDGLASVRQDGRWGALGTDGQLAFAPSFDALYEFGSGLAAAKRVEWPAGPAQLPSEWHVLPEGGLTHAVFSHLGSGDELRVTVCFTEPPSPEQMVAAEHIEAALLDVLRANSDGRPVLGGNRGMDWIAEYAISFRLTNVEWPARAAQTFVDELQRANLPIREVVFMPFREQPDNWRTFTMYKVVPAVPHPDDPGGSDFFDTFPQYLQQAFDVSATPPASESAQNLLAGRMDRAMNVFTDERLMTLHHPRVRICYGVCQEGFMPADARSGDLGNAVIDALARRFDRNRIWVFPGNHNWFPPEPITRSGDLGIEPFEAHGRRGYCFGVEAHPLLMDIGPDVFRYRETELMDALAEVVLAKGLAPVLMWQRFGDPVNPNLPHMPGSAFPMVPNMYVFNLWEA